MAVVILMRSPMEKFFWKHWCSLVPSWTVRFLARVVGTSFQTCWRILWNRKNQMKENHDITSLYLKIFYLSFHFLPLVVDALASAKMSRYIRGLLGVFSCKTLNCALTILLGTHPLYTYHAKEFFSLGMFYVLGRGACRGTPWNFS